MPCKWALLVGCRASKWLSCARTPGSRRNGLRAAIDAAVDPQARARTRRREGASGRSCPCRRDDARGGHGVRARVPGLTTMRGPARSPRRSGIELPHAAIALCGLPSDRAGHRSLPTIRPTMENPLQLSSAELDALRGLREGGTELGPDDPVWDELEQFGLVESREKAPYRQLTPAGRNYPIA